ncbi:pyridoxine/pyridoxamine 5'-phosphate oxidase [Thiosulfatimonas sediminis]|uniref:Pyridoxine/pyridoxamine 5'-phosphate oxidase n=1 Tax=Thiosulfatimonas sediminis TaxID=2675054 RepID=A0A6F8PY42_9GAMM|nr:pyridoxamine 5'-phosphate oxidase [Thiosulfatimonas sediminis]BBP47041.1 pyridoxine/pyridoxamine 5'-phosphate oxidase [Thiosulfatimonas sediminis]
MTDKTQRDLSDYRQRYLQGGLDENDVPKNPFELFSDWFAQVEEAQLIEPNAMVVATVDADGMPSTRTVLLKYFDESGFVFYTNFSSEKAKHIEHNPQVSLQFLWLGLERQVKIQGIAEKVSTTESLKYFASRPKGSQIGAWVSHQSQVISNKQLLLNQYQKMVDKFKHGEVPFPDFWGGYRIKPLKIEFWQGGDNRLHDRIEYQRNNANGWQINRLAP